MKRKCSPVKLMPDLIDRASSCQTPAIRFRELWPKGMFVTEKNCRKILRSFPASHVQYIVWGLWPKKTWERFMEFVRQEDMWDPVRRDRRVRVASRMVKLWGRHGRGDGDIRH